MACRRTNHRAASQSHKISSVHSIPILFANVRMKQPRSQLFRGEKSPGAFCLVSSPLALSLNDSQKRTAEPLPHFDPIDKV
jgi:hypothetical protein